MGKRKHGKGKRKGGNYAPKSLFNPADNSIRKEIEPDTFISKKVAWGLGKIDIDGSWGWNNIEITKWWTDILPKLKNFETMTWGQVISASGGKSTGSGTNNHNIPVDKIIKKARDRLEEIHLDDIDEVFSLRLSGDERIYGILEGNILKVVWYDPNHEICPSTKR